MRKENVLILFLFLLFGFVVSSETAAAKKLEKIEPQPLYVQQGKTYKLSKILADIEQPWEDKSVMSFLKGKKVKWSADKKQIKLTKNSIKVKKQGDFKLTGRTKKYKYIITLKSRPEKMKAIPEGITRVSIRKGETKVELTDINTIKTLR